MLSKDLLTPGDLILGKWQKNRYQVLKKIGSGANGEVYLVRKNQFKCALKISEGLTDLSNEVYVIRTLQKTQGYSLGLFVFDIDDYFIDDKLYSFYVMSYLEGETLKDYWRHLDLKRKKILVAQIIEQLSLIHQLGWVFGDLKPEHIIVKDHKIQFLDFGGVTKVGNSIKQFTPLYDRANWKKGIRRAEPSYDYFSLAIILLELIYSKKELEKYLLSNSWNTVEKVLLTKKNIGFLRECIVHLISPKVNKEMIIEDCQKKEQSFEDKWVEALFLFSAATFVLTIFYYLI